MEFVLGIDSVTVIGGGGRYEFDHDSYVFNWQSQNATLTGVEIDEVMFGTLSLNGVTVTAGQFIAWNEFVNLAWEAPGKPTGVVEAIKFTMHGTGWTTGDLEDDVPNIASFEYDYFDLIRGTNKSELIDGTNTRDTLDGGAGNDKLRGRRLEDHFVFKNGYDKDTILDGEL